jgi:hypothetical protein
LFNKLIIFDTVVEVRGVLSHITVSPGVDPGGDGLAEGHDDNDGDEEEDDKDNCDGDGEER